MRKLLYILLFVPLALFGQDNYSLSFDGVDDYVEINPSSDLLIHDDISILFDVYFQSTSDDFQTILGHGVAGESSSENIIYSIELKEDTLRYIHENDGGDNVYVYLQNSIELHQWYNFALIRKSSESTIDFYINDSLVLSHPNVSNPDGGESSLGRLAFGRLYNETGNHFSGTIDNISIWNKSLSSNDVLKYKTCLPFENEDSLVGYWNFNEGSGNTIFDYSGNENHGTIYGATFSEDVPESSCEYSILDQLNQSFDAWNISIDLSAGWNMFGYGCPSPINIAEGLSNHTDIISIVKDNNGNVYMPEFSFNGIGDLTPGFGYQIKVIEAIEGFSLCDWYVNNIPEDNIVSLQDSIDMLNSDILDLECINQGACFFNHDLNTCNYPSEGYDCEGELILQIGDIAFGGIVFYIDETEHHGLVAAMEDLFYINGYPIIWGCYGENVNGADGTDIGSGHQNTIDIVNHGCAEENHVIAAQAAYEYQSESYTDWFLPSKDELMEMYNTIGTFTELSSIGGFDPDDSPYYWSSSEYNDNYAWIVSFGDDLWYYNNGPLVNNYPKESNTRIRPIRSF